MKAQLPYGRAERLLHHLAFGRPRGGAMLQRRLAEVEDSLLAPELEALPAKPVFVTALPRAGTTLLLSLLAGLDEFASHTYRDMPFPLCPWLWQRLSQGFRRPSRERERLHGDGVMVGFDSPEAFEEVVWLAFWGQKYRDDHILTWGRDDRNAEFERFLGRHMRKVITARASERPGREPRRYLSKNNANIARLSLLPELFPDGRIVIPVRDPWTHAGSLLKQHLRFSKLHAQDPFARRYMAWLGHFEFGAELRPIRFSGTGQEPPAGQPEELEFWLQYWLDAHQAILARTAPQFVLLDYATLCAEPAATLDGLALALGIACRGRLLAMAEQVRSPTTRPGDAPEQASPLGRRAGELYEALRARCLNAPARPRVA